MEDSEEILLGLDGDNPKLHDDTSEANCKINKFGCDVHFVIFFKLMGNVSKAEK